MISCDPRLVVNPAPYKFQSAAPEWRWRGSRGFRGNPVPWGWN